MKMPGDASEKSVHRVLLNRCCVAEDPLDLMIELAALHWAIGSKSSEDGEENGISVRGQEGARA